MSITQKEEIDKLEKLKEINDKLSDFFQDKREDWNKKISPLFETLKIKVSLENSQKILECQALCLSYRQILNEQISVFLDKRSKQEVKLKKSKQDKFMYYATGFGVKTNLSEKNILIDADVAEDQRNIELIENYIEFLRQNNKNLESLQYTIKNIIDLFSLLK